MRFLIAAAVILAVSTPSRAQPVDEPIPRIVADLQGVWGGLPASPGWVPEVPLMTPIPNRGFGIGFGAHFYPLRLGKVTFGAGASVITARGTGDPSGVVISTTGTTVVTGEATLPVVKTKTTSVEPQLSINFGHRYGWSYLSAGYGPVRIDSSASAVGTLPASSAPDQWNPALNFGGGARWFMKQHIGANFDVRFTKLGSRGATETAPFAKRAQIINLLVGISVQ